MLLSSELEARRLPSGLNATLRTRSPWPWKRPISAREATSHSRMLRSAEPDARRAPSGLNATIQTRSAWPWRRATNSPEAASQSRMPPSSEPVARRLPSGLNATGQAPGQAGTVGTERHAHHASPMALEGGALPAGGEIPQADGPVGRGGGQEVAGR